MKQRIQWTTTMGKFFISLVVAVNLSACGPSHLSSIRIDTTHLEEVIQITDERTTSLAEIKSIVDDVCNQHKLKLSTEKNPPAIKYARYWGSANHQHPNTLYLSLSADGANEHIVEINIFEWDTFSHTEFGEKIVAQLLKELKALVPEQEITLENM